MTGRVCRARLSSAPVVCSAMVLNVLLLLGPPLLVAGNHEFHITPHLATFGLLISVWCVVEGRIGRAETVPNGAAAGPGWLPLAIGLALLITFWVAVTSTLVSARAPSTVPPSIGALLMSTGIGLRFLAIRRLGRFFLNEVAVLPAQPLVTEGVYGAMRHPSETGTLSLAFGAAMLLGSLPALLACTLVLLPCVVWRTQLEDRLLRERHPDAFSRYVREVPAFLPGMHARGRLRACRLSQGVGCLGAAGALISQSDKHD